MAINNCSSRVALAVLAFIILPAQQYLSGLLGFDNPFLKDAVSLSPSGVPESFNFTSEHVLPVDVIMTMTLLVTSVWIYISEWIQRKLKEKRIIKLKEMLSLSLDRLNAWNERQQHLESRLQMIQIATTEYNLLLYLLLQRNRQDDSSPTTYFFEKEHNDDFDW